MIGFSNQESRRSQLTFVSSQESTEPLDFRYLKRAREPVGRSKSGVQGKIADVFSNRSRHAESQNELKGFRVLLATGRADDWQEQPFLLEYHRDGVKRRYTPDVLVVWGMHREVVEIKDDAEADLPESQQRFALVRELLADHGYHFRVWRRSEISAEPRLANAGLLLRYRCVTVSPMEQEIIRRVFAFAPEVCLRTFCETHGIAVQSILRMVLDGTLHINWWKPITLDSQISRAPIGPRVWPFPPHDAQPQDCTRRSDVAIRI
jgi:hypothetical protein